jgi:hypothetical protein
VFVSAHWHAVVRQVGHGQQQGLQLGLDGLQPRGRCFQFGLGGADLGHGGIGLGMQTLALQAANLFGQAVALRLQLFGAHLNAFALGFQCREGGFIQIRLGLLALVEFGQDLGQVFAQKGNVQHGDLGSGKCCF